MTRADHAVVDLQAVYAAATRIAPWVHRTPILRSRAIDDIVGAEVHLKAEHLQKAGAFKARGAHNAVFALDETSAAAGVATHSSGNHGAALALAASARGIPAHVVVPDNAPTVKVDAMTAYGAEVTRCPPTLVDREAGLARVVEATGAVPVHPFAHPAVIAGQGTVALEILEQMPEPPEAILAPVGGGGLLSGIGIAVATTAPDCDVIGVEPSGADDAARSFREGVRHEQLDPRTIADGLRTSLGEPNFEIITATATDIVTVDDDHIIEAMRLLWTRAKAVVEPSGAVPLAALLADPDAFAGRRVAVVLSGGNLDPDGLPW